MTLRFLLYIAHLYEKIIERKNKFSRKLQKVAKPEFYVFYNGHENIPQVSELNFSDAVFDVEPKLQIELKATVFNLNNPHEKLLRCKALQEYTSFVKIVEGEMKKGGKDCFTRAIDKCIENGILAEYLERNSTEVRNMLFGEYDRDMDIAVQREEAWEDGVEVGMQRGVAVGISQTALRFKEIGVPHEDIAKATGLSLEEIEALKEE